MNIRVGLAASIRNLSGKSPELFISDARQKQYRTLTAARFISKEMRSRYLNPQWISQMQEEGYSGAISMLKTVNTMFGWQVTAPDTIRDDQWQAIHDVYIADKYKLDINQWFDEQHPVAQMQLIERMAEAARKHYWQVDAAMMASLAQRYQQLQKAILNIRAQR